MKSNFVYRKIGDLCDVTKLAGFEFTKYINYSDSGDIIALRALNLRNGFLELSDIKKIDKETSDLLIRSKLYIGDIVLTYTGNGYGDCALINENNKYHLAPNICKISPSADVDSYYLYSIIRTKWFKKLLTNYIGGSGQPTIPMKTIRQLEIPLSSLNIQKKISQIIRYLDEKIILNNKINDNLSLQATTLFEEWLKTCDDEVSINDLADNILDYTPLKSDKVVLVNSSDVTRGRFEHHLLSDNKDLKGHFKKRFKKFDILYSEIRPRNGHYAYCQFEPENYIASTRLMVIRSKNNMISSSLLYQYLLSKKVFDEFTLKTESRSGTFPQGNYQDMAAIRVPYSKKEMQIQISSNLDSIYNEIWCNEKENIRLSELRDTLLPKLMSGEIDVSDIKLDL